MGDTIHKWVTPDWTEESNYPVKHGKGVKLDDLDGREILQITWEFLRRNPNYQSDYYKYFSPQYEIDDASFEQWENDIEDGVIPMYPYYICEPPSSPEESKPQYLKRMFGNKWCIKPRANVICEKYGLEVYPPDPNTDRPLVFFSTGSGVSIQTAHNEKLEGLASWKLDKTSEMFIRIDLNMPINSLMKRIKERLKREQKILKKKGLINPLNTKIEVNLLPLYLRVLDAIACGVCSPSKIARIIFPNKDNSYPLPSEVDKIEHAIEKSIKLRDVGYIYFPTRK